MTLLPPTVELQRRIDEEMAPDPEARKRDVAALREWLSKQPHLPKHMDDKRLEHFLFSCKNSLERCKMRLEIYFSARTALPEFFSDRDPMGRDIQDCCDNVEYLVCPKMTDDGHRVTILRLKETDIDKFSLVAVSKRITMILDLRLLEEPNLSNVMVIDLKGFTAAHFAKCVPAQPSVKKAMLAIQNAMPFRLHSVHYLHSPSFVSNVINLFYPLLKKKLTEKFFVHTGGGEDLSKFMNRDILPNEYGGKAGSFQELNEAWRLKLEKHRDWFLRDEKISRTDESKRLPNSKCLINDELAGLQGSFRKLNID
ncbi:alpha-tocopherol transfer protein-like [Copidosoma floridanum]|uniref:alpha-tocopherol transfer protein-like n=1 Tax=Copidosoma floridanum TaxID=29053 RepID=UPI0006C9B9F7|nr:alpha-tocopherol transfer protein-like [Copidosoma floridanum]XP_014219814.1 alpha-tocopherol transfer protein-like [Copidosoma floridanum]